MKWIKIIHLSVLTTTLFLTCLLHTALGQSKKVIFLRDKNLSPFSIENPQDYLSQRAIDRRKNYQIPIDSSDLPVNPGYISAISSLNNIQIIGASKWLNALIIECENITTLEQINNLPFVRKVENIALRNRLSKPDKWEKEASSLTPLYNKRNHSFSEPLKYGASDAQIRIHNGYLLHKIGARGEEMMIAFFDAGYKQYNNNRFIDSAIMNNQIIATKDFYSNNPSVEEDDAHGLYCFSIVAANISGEYIGSGPKAKYLLLRTEDANSEQIIEEYMWALGAEYADSCGANVFSSSVGYTTFDDPSQNHNYNELNGNTAIVTIAADKAASKGILVITSAGNEGTSGWKYMGTPADGDSVFAVGAVNLQKQIASFSSFGPTANGRTKPDALSVGVATALIGPGQSIISSSGTSYATPNLAGLATCLWQLFPELNNMQLAEILRKSSDRYESPDEQYGYGIPNMAKAMAVILQQKANLEIEKSGCSAILKWKSTDRAGMGYIIQKRNAEDRAYTAIDTIYSISEKWSENNYNFTDLYLSGKTHYKIIQLLDTASEDLHSFVLDSTTLIPADLCTKKNIFIYPNPSNKFVFIKFNGITPSMNLQVVIYDSRGQQVRNIFLDKPLGNYMSPGIPINGLSSGVYYIQLYNNNTRIATDKIIFQRNQ